MSLFSRFKRGINAFINNKDPTSMGLHPDIFYNSSSVRPDGVVLSTGGEKTILTAIINRIASDAAAVDIRHVDLDENGRYAQDHDSALNECLTLDSNLDQTARQFKLDLFTSLCDEGCIAVVPIDTKKPLEDGISDIYSMRVGRIEEWSPTAIRVQVYNEQTGEKQPLICNKETTAIIQNPFYHVMNSPNSTFRRLVRKLMLLDKLDDKVASDRLDLIFQMPYAANSPLQQEKAEKRRKSLENQLVGSSYGIAYMDATEKVIQLNRPLENNLWSQVDSLTSMLYSQLGMTRSIIEGTSTEQENVNYYNNTIEPLLAVVVEEFRRKFLTRNVRKTQTIMYFKDPFRLVPVTQVADLSDKLTRNEILSSNEVRCMVGFKPSDDPGADELRNKNLNQSKKAAAEGASESESLINKIIKEETSK